MIDGLKPYPDMKDSGVPWLGGVPVHWEVRKIREVARVVNGFPFDAAHFTAAIGHPVLRIRDLNKRHTTARYDGSWVEEARVEPGDVLIGMDGDFNVGTWAGDEPALLNQRMCCVRAEDSATEAFFRYVLPQPLKEINEATWSTTVKHLASGQVERIAFGFPPLPEQAAMVRFLDYVDRRIRRYIGAKQKLIKLLEEQKQAIIDRAVTRGLDPDVRLKPSGVEWLGDVPEHWEVRRIRTVLADTRAGIWGSDPRPENVDDQVVCLRVADFDMRRLRVSPRKLTVREVPASVREPRLLAPGDILMEKSGGGDAEPVGRVVLYDGQVAPKAITSNFIVRLRPNTALVAPEFLLLLLAMMQSTRRNVPSIKQTTGIQNLDERAYLSLAIGVPPTDEQRHILLELEAPLRNLEQSVERSDREIVLLREYRTRLIADVVTGKLDVREAAVHLPDEAEESERLEPEPLDEAGPPTKADDATADDLDTVLEEAEA